MRELGTHRFPHIRVVDYGGVYIEMVIHEHHEAVVGKKAEVPKKAVIDRCAVGHAQVAGTVSLQ